MAAALSKEILLISWNCDGLSNKTHLPRAVTHFEKVLKRKEAIPTIICLQEISESDAEGSTKLGRKTYAVSGTDKSDSGNQKCNTAVYWDADFTKTGRYSQHHGNRYYEAVKLKFCGFEFWVMCMHMPSLGPAGYAKTGTDLGALFAKEVLERAPMIAVGDMNCQPANFVGKKGVLCNPQTPTRWKSQKELDWMILHGTDSVQLSAQCLGVADMGGTSDHLPVGFLVEIR
jgi:endonuclease/exonuclease/phosphatase family metal-dependent hydrolase